MAFENPTKENDIASDYEAIFGKGSASPTQPNDIASDYDAIFGSGAASQVKPSSAQEDWEAMNAAKPTEASATEEPRGNIVTDTLVGLGKGALQLPGAATGLADIPAGLMGFDRPFSKGAEALGEVTGFQPGKWAKEADATYSPEMQQARANVEQAWQDPNTGALDVAEAYLKNPRSLYGTVVESLPSMFAGSALGRAATGLGALPAATPAAEIAKRATLAAGVGEGAVMAGQAMENINPEVDPQKAALAATAIGVGGGLIGTQSGRAMNALGLDDVDTLIASRGLARGTGNSALSVPARVAANAIQEGPIEEGSQSALETAAQNWAEDKPITEGMTRNVVEGSLAGMAMGAPAGLISGKGQQEAVPPPDTALYRQQILGEEEQTEPAAEAPQVAPATEAPAEQPDPVEEQAKVLEQSGPVGRAAANAVRSGAKPAEEPPVAEEAANQAEPTEQPQGEKPVVELETVPQTADPFAPETLASLSNSELRSLRQQVGVAPEQDRPRIRAALKAETQRRFGLKQEAEQNENRTEEKGLSESADASIAAVPNANEDAAKVEPLPVSTGPETNRNVPVGEAAPESVPPTEGKRNLVTVNDTVVDVDALSDEQKRQWAEADDSYRLSLQSADQPFIAKQDKAKIEKAAGMELSAARRKITGLLTAKEQQKQEADARKIREQSPVILQDGRKGTALGRPSFGKVKVQLEDGSVAQLPYADVRVNLEPQEQVVNGKSTNPAPQETEEPARQEVAFPFDAVGEQQNRILSQVSEDDKKNGNYQKTQTAFQGIPLRIENGAGSLRHGINLTAHYGEIPFVHDTQTGEKIETRGADKDYVDVFIRPQMSPDDIAKSKTVFVIDQLNPKTGAYDEAKVVLGAKTLKEAKDLYLSNYEAGWKGLGAIRGVKVEAFKQWLASGDTHKPFTPEKVAKTQAKEFANVASEEKAVLPSNPPINPEQGEAEGTTLSAEDEKLTPIANISANKAGNIVITGDKAAIKEQLDALSGWKKQYKETANGFILQKSAASLADSLVVAVKKYPSGAEIRQLADGSFYSVTDKESSTGFKTIKDLKDRYLRSYGKEGFDQAFKEVKSRVEKSTQTAPTSTQPIFEKLGYRQPEAVRKQAMQELENHPLAERMKYVEDNFIDLLSELEQSGKVKIKC